jgi:hypothetical protein
MPTYLNPPKCGLRELIGAESPVDGRRDAYVARRRFVEIKEQSGVVGFEVRKDFKDWARATLM